jgi:uncharacterized FlaG/YvyC family protein
MSDNPINSINRVETQSIKTVQAQVTQIQAQYQKESAQVKPVETPKKEDATQSNTNKGSSFQEGRQTNLQFRVDPQKNEVMVVVVDRETNKVIATIPPDAIKDIPPGELMQYSA